MADPVVLEGLVLDRYVIEEELGRGAMGVVYRGRHAKLPRPVAIKVLHSHLIDTPTMIDRFQREARLAAKLVHKNLVAVLDVDQLPDGRHLMVQELVTGKSLADECARGPMPEVRVIALVKQICDGLEVAHRAGLVHRDLKPENIVIEHDTHGQEVPRIIDFGIALARFGETEARLTEMGVAIGTPVYMSPEQATGVDLDHRSDLFALGVIMYELLAGKQPFDGDGVEIVTANLLTPAPSIANRAGVKVAPGVEAIVIKLMAKRRGDRYMNAREVREALDGLAGEPRIAYLGTRRPPTIPPMDRPRRRRSSLVPIAKKPDEPPEK